MEQLIAKIKGLAKQHLDEVISYRRHLHQYPELSFEEAETAKYISSVLTKYGIQHECNVAGHGIVGEINGGDAESPVIYLRGDIDALPIIEENEVDYKSKNEGVMHACGHDVHTASLLGTLIVLNQIKEQFTGKVRFIFQPAEEKLPGGASLMIKEGVLDNPKGKAIFGQHVFPDLEAGKVGFRPGAYMASCDEVYVKVIGVGGHAAVPSKYNNPLLIAAELLLEFDEVELQEKSVLAFGKIEGLGATNVIPNEVNIQGTFRAMDEEYRAEIHQTLEELAQEVAMRNDARIEVDIHKGYPFLVNEEELTLRSKSNAIEFLGEENVIDLPIRLTAEDFAYYSQYMSSCFYRLGTRNEAQGKTCAVHNSRFDIDEDALETSVGLMAYLAIKEINHEG